RVLVAGYASEYSLIEFEVRDTGIGVPLDAQDKVFESFSQADTSTNRKYGGTGLGLTLCKQFCDMMDGSIELISSPGEGSTFKFLIPLKSRILDFDEVLERLGGDRLLVDKLLRSFVDRYNDEAARIRNELESGETEKALHRIHSLKGVAGNLSAKSVFESAKKLESAVRSGTQPVANELVTELTSGLAATMVNIRDWLSERGTGGAK
ncbi:MAG: ATP-binding protein, partial [Syntrophobacteraceae bacterium]